MDKIPLDEIVRKGPKSSYLYGIKISKCEEANGEKINQLIDWCRELSDRLNKIEGK